MGLIIKKLRIIGPKGKRDVRALLDSGANHCLMREDIARHLADPDDPPEPKDYESAVGHFTARRFVVGDVVIRGKRLTQLFKVVPNLTEETIIGVDFMQAWHVSLDPRTRRFHVDPESLRLRAVGSRPVRRR